MEISSGISFDFNSRRNMPSFEREASTKSLPTFDQQSCGRSLNGTPGLDSPTRKKHGGVSRHDVKNRDFSTKSRVNNDLQQGQIPEDEPEE